MVAIVWVTLMATRARAAERDRVLMFASGSTLAGGHDLSAKVTAFFARIEPGKDAGGQWSERGGTNTHRAEPRMGEILPVATIRTSVSP